METGGGKFSTKFTPMRCEPTPTPTGLEKRGRRRMMRTRVVVKQTLRAPIVLLVLLALLVLLMVLLGLCALLVQGFRAMGL
eukprot:1713537-Pyramimonas_sp.AAC.1